VKNVKNEKAFSGISFILIVTIVSSVKIETILQYKINYCFYYQVILILLMVVQKERNFYNCLLWTPANTKKKLNGPFRVKNWFSQAAKMVSRDCRGTMCDKGQFSNRI